MTDKIIGAPSSHSLAGLDQQAGMGSESHMSTTTENLHA
jgi:hypothetical protein